MKKPKSKRKGKNKRKHQTPHLGLNVIGPRIRRIRKSLSPAVTQDDLVGRLAVLGIQMDRSTIAKIETQIRFLNDFEIIAIAKALRLPVENFFYDGLSVPSDRSIFSKPAL